MPAPENGRDARSFARGQDDRLRNDGPSWKPYGLGLEEHRPIRPPFRSHSLYLMSDKNRTRGRTRSRPAPPWGACGRHDGRRQLAQRTRHANSKRQLGEDAFKPISVGPVHLAHLLPLRIEQDDAKVVHDVVVVGPEAQVKSARQLPGALRITAQKVPVLAVELVLRAVIAPICG